MPIPAFTHTGVLPPYLIDPVGHARSPYLGTIEEVVGRFATSVERRTILRGLLDYRRALQVQLGLAKGLQWLDGSFVEDIENSENRPPGDIDVLTIAQFPPARTLSPTQQQLFDPDLTRKQFRCDAYPLDLARLKSVEHLLQQVTYWFGLFGHRRSGEWKGLVAVPLDPAADLRAQNTLGAS